MKLRILIPVSLLLISIAPVAYASEITGTLTAGGNSVTGTVIGIPTATPAPGTYASAQSVTLTDPGSASIRYTTDGSAPSCAGDGLLYSGPIAVASSLTIRAVACYSSGASSTVGSYPYVISNSSLTGTVATSSGGSLTGTVTTTSGGSLSGTVTSSPGGSLTGTVTAPASNSGGGGTSSGGGGGGGGSNGPPVGSIGSSSGGSGPGVAIIPTGASTPAGQVLGASTGPTTTPTPGVPNTGKGGNAAGNILMLIISGMSVIVGGFYLVVRGSQLH